MEHFRFRGRHELIDPTFLQQGIFAMRHIPSLRVMLVFLLASISLLLPQVSTASPLQDQPPEPVYAAGEVVIGWQPGMGPVSEVRNQPAQLGTDKANPEWQVAVAEIAGATGLKVLNASPRRGTARLAVARGSEAAEVARLRRLPWVRYAEPNYYAYAAETSSASALYPNDPDFPRQWNMQRIDAPDAWSATRGSLSFVVAVLDTGVAQSHPEFADQLLPGYNYLTDQPGAEDDDPRSHGTHVSGILNARMNNGLGVAGLAPDVKILPLKVLDSNEIGRNDAIAAAIEDAADRRAQVISLSLASTVPSQLLADAVAYAQAQGSLVVAAAGNCAQNPSSCGGQVNPNIYPAAIPGVLAVAASDRFDRYAPYSGYKPYIGLAAPGGTSSDPVWSTTRTGYGALYGTSMSTPLVSAAAALVWTLRPAATPQEIADILKSTADKVGSDPYSGESLSYPGGRNDYFGSGRLNVSNAVRWVYPPSIAAASSDVSVLLGGEVTTASRSVAVTNPSGQGVYWQATILAGAPWLTLTRATGTSLYNSSASLTLAAAQLDLQPGTYSGTIRVQSVYPSGLPPVDIRVQLRVAAALSRTFVPLVAQDMQPGWLDPYADGVYIRSVLPLTNDSLAGISLPFPVTFYGATYQSLQVSDNGLVLFGAADPAAARPPASCPGNGMPPNNAIYALGYDWNPSLGMTVIAHQANATTVVITWQDARRAAGTPVQSFQLVITSDSKFRANYRTVESPTPGIVGTENYDGSFSQQVLCNGAGRPIKSGDVVGFETQLPW